MGSWLCLLEGPSSFSRTSWSIFRSGNTVAKIGPWHSMAWPRAFFPRWLFIVESHRPLTHHHLWCSKTCKYFLQFEMFFSLIILKETREIGGGLGCSREHYMPFICSLGWVGVSLRELCAFCLLTGLHRHRPWSRLNGPEVWVGQDGM